jgi:hypothetical protein
MPILNYTTEIAVEKSMGQVIGALTKRGVTRISTTFDDDGKPAGIAFTMKTDYGIREFELPVRAAGVQAALIKDGVQPKYRTIEHAARVAWRIAKDWLEAQSALIDADLASLDEVMTPYMVAGKNGETVYQMLRTAGLKELES